MLTFTYTEQTQGLQRHGSVTMKVCIMIIYLVFTTYLLFLFAFIWESCPAIIIILNITLSHRQVMTELG